MSEGSQPRLLRNSRAERVTTSCGECRRRKQKCDQRQPCGNCARRFPQPPCEYKPAKRTVAPGLSTLPTFTVALRPDRFSEPNDIPGTRNALLDEPQPPWVKRGGEVVRWSGIDITTTYPSTAAAGTSTGMWSSPWTDLPGSMAPGNLPMCDKDCRVHSEAIHDAVKLLMHHFSIPDKFLGQDEDWNPANSPEWLLHWNAASNAAGAGGPAWPIGSATDELRHLPMAATRQNGELLRICQPPPPNFLPLSPSSPLDPSSPYAPFPVLSAADLQRVTDLKLLCRFKASLDGNPEPSNPFVKQYVPYCIQDPLLLQIILYTSSCFLNETGHVPRTMVMAHKGLAIRMLNEHLRSDTTQTSDAAIAGVIQLIVDEWYWGETQDLNAHLRGLREMIRIRGGFSQLGMNGFLAKNAIAHDVSIALAHEINPFLNSGEGYEFTDPILVPFRMAHNSPFVSGLPSFATCASSLGLHPATASILDDMRFLMNAVLSLPPNPTSQQLQKVKSTSEWIHNRISQLNPTSGASREPTPEQAGPFLTPKSQSRHSTASPEGRTERRHSDSQRGSKVAEEERRSRRASQQDASASNSRGSPEAASGSGSATTASQSHSATVELEQPDFLYMVVRMSALVYSRAIMNRRPLSETCTPGEFLKIWTSTWRVPLSTWKSSVGIFNWIMLGIVPSCHTTPHARFVKSMLMISVLTLGMDNWHVTMEAAMGGLKLQQWLKGEDIVLARGADAENADSPEGGGEGVLKHGYQQPEW